MQKATVAPPASTANYITAVVLLFLAAVGAWHYATKEGSYMPHGIEWLSVFLILGCLGCGLYILINPNKTIQAETYRSWYLATAYFGAGTLVLMGLILTVLLFWLDLSGQGLNPLFYLIPAAFIIAGVLRIYYAKSMLTGKKWVRNVQIAFLTMLFIGILVRFILLVTAGADRTSLGWTMFMLIVTGASALFFVFNKRMKEFYTQ